MISTLKGLAYWVAALAIVSMVFPIGQADANPFYYTGGVGGDFFDESNWNSMSNGSGISPDPNSINPNAGIDLDLIIDGDEVLAEGTVDIGAGGSLDLQTGSILDVIDVFFSAQLEISTGATFSFTDSTLTVADDIFFRGTTNFSGGTVESFGDDVEFRSSNTTISGTSFIADDSIIVRAELTPEAGSSIVGASFEALSRLNIDDFNMTVTDSTFDIVADVEDIFDCTDEDCAIATLTLLGSSSLTADQIQEGSKVVIDDNSIVTLTNQEFEPDDDELTWLTQASTRVTLNSPTAMLVLQNSQLEASDAKIFNGVTGLSYAEDSISWDPNSWSGSTAETLQILSIAQGPDFDSDGFVSGLDFLVWQEGLGLTGQLDNSTGDSTGDGNVAALDLLSWERLYGKVVEVSPLQGIAVVPEPTTGWLIATAVLAFTTNGGRGVNLRSIDP